MKNKKNISSEIPQYESLDDVHCEIVRTHKSQRQVVTIRKHEAKTRSGTASTIRSNSSKRRKGKKRAVTEHSTVTRSTSTEKSGITFQRPMGSDPASEVEVLKCILLRENQIEKLKGIVRNQSSLEENGEIFSDIIDRLRIVTAETIENIVKWRRGAPKASQFIWNGVNYLLRIPSDLDFLSKHDEIEAWFGANARRNPFMINRCLDHSPAKQQFDNSTTTCNGNTPTKLNTNRSNKGSPGNISRISKTPYTTPVINDPSMIKGSRNDRVRTEHQSQQKKKQVKLDLSHQIGLIDMVRILEAERLLLQEEEIFGEFTRNNIGQLVPVLIGKDESNRAGTHSRSPCISKQDYISSNETSRNFKKEILEQETQTHVKLSVKMKASKKGGDLSSLSTKGTTGRKQLPSKRSRGARIDLDVKRARKTAEQLNDALSKSKDDLAQLENELALLEAEEMQEELGNIGTDRVESMLRAQKIQEKQNEFELLRQEIIRRENEVTQKKFEAERKAAARDEFKRRQHIEQLKSRDTTLARKRAQGAAFSVTIDLDANGSAEEQRLFDDIQKHGMPPPSPESAETLLAHPEHSNAIQLQRVVRGKLGRIKFSNVFRVYSKAALRIQSWMRTYFGKCKAALARLRQESCVLIQKVYRGYVGRKKYRRIFLTALHRSCSIKFQKVYRGKVGRTRSKNKRELNASSNECYTTANQIYESDITELASIKGDLVEPNLLSLMQCCMILTARGTSPPNRYIERVMTWKACKRCLRRPFFMRKVRALANAAKESVLFIHPGRVASVERHLHDPGLSVKNLARVKKGARAAQLLMQWINAILRVIKVIPIFIEDGAENSPEWLKVLDTDDPSGLELWEAGDDGYDSDAIDPERYVPEELLKCHLKRPRPIVVVIAKDIPLRQHDLLIHQLKTTLPSTFVHVKQETLDTEILQTLLDGGHSIIVETDIGYCFRDRRAFLRIATVCKASLVPSPVFILLHGHNKNRGTQTFEHINRNQIDDFLDEGADEFLGVGDQLAGDSKLLKQYLEDMNSAIFEIARPIHQRELQELIAIQSPDVSVVLIAEAIIILLSPEMEFKGPENTIGAVSWQAAIKLFKGCTCEQLSRAFAAVEVDNIPPLNLNALRQYERHYSWLSHEESNPKFYQIPLLRLFSWWVASVIRYATLLQECGGKAGSITKASNDIFSAVIPVRDGIQTYPRGYVPKPGSWPTHLNGDILKQEDGWKNTFIHLLSAIMRDLKVHGESIVETGTKRRIIISVFRDQIAERIFFIGYDPIQSLYFYCELDHCDINKALGPNSVEMKDPRQAPRSATDLYKRLIELLALQRPRQNKIGAPPNPYQLLLRRKRRRLLRGVRKLESHSVVVTASEIAPGEIALEVYHPASSKHYEFYVDQKILNKIISKSESKREKSDLKSKTGSRMVTHLIDRLILRRVPGRARNLKLSLQTGPSTGRKIFEGSIVISGQKHIVTVHISSSTGFLHIETYHPSTCTRTRFCLSQRARIQLLHSTNEGDREKYLNVLFSRIHQHKMKDKNETSYGNVFNSSSSSDINVNDIENVKPTEKVIVLDRSLLKLSLRIPYVKDPEELKENMPKGSILMIEFCISQWALEEVEEVEHIDEDELLYDDIDSADEDEEEDNVYAKTEFVSKEAIDILAFNRATGKIHKITLRDRDMRKLTKSNLKTKWPNLNSKDELEDCLREIAGRLRMTRDEQNVIIKDTTGKTIGKYESQGRYDRPIRNHSPSSEENSKDEVKVGSEQKAKVLQDVILENLDNEDVLDHVRSVEVAEPMFRPDGEIAYKHGHKLRGQRYVIICFWKTPLQTSPSERFQNLPISSKPDTLHSDKDIVPIRDPALRYGYTIECYDPQRLYRSAVPLLTDKAMRAAVGKSQYLLHPNNESKFIEYMINHRIYLEDEEPFRMRVLTSKLFGVEKVTPLNKVDVEDEYANRFNDELVILPNEQKEKNVSDTEKDICDNEPENNTGDKMRGVKLLSVGSNIIIDGNADMRTALSEYLIVTVFETGQGNLFVEQGAGTAPTVNIYAYNPAKQTNIKLAVSAPDLFEVIDGRRELLSPNRRNDLVKTLITGLRIKRSRNKKDKLILPWKRNREEKQFSVPPTFQGKAGVAREVILSTGIKTIEGSRVVVRATQIYSEQEGKIALWFLVYHPLHGVKADVRAPQVLTDKVITLDRSNTVRKSNVIFQYLKKHLTVHVEPLWDGKTKKMTANLIESQDSDKGNTISSKPNEAEGCFSNIEPSELYLHPSVVSGNCLHKGAVKLNSIYGVVTAHELLNKEKGNLEGVVFRVYCPSISQQSSTSLDVAELYKYVSIVNHVDDISREDLKRAAKLAVSRLSIRYNGIESHMELFLEKSGN